METTYNAKAKSDAAFGNAPNNATPYAVSKDTDGRDPARVAFTSHIPEERTDDFGLSDANSQQQPGGRGQAMPPHT